MMKYARKLMLVSLLAIIGVGCATASSETAGGDKAPEAVVDRQLDAYNSGDIDAFMATYSPTIEIFNHPDTPRFSGVAAMRERYAKLFNDTPDLQCTILNRIVLGDQVIDHEHVTGYSDGRVVNAVAIYEVKEGLIQRVWFIRE